MNMTLRPNLLASLALLTMLGGVSAPVRAELPIQQTPLYLATAVDPAFLMAVDDSGSMNWESLVRNQDGEMVWGQDAAGRPWGFFEDDGSLRNGGSTTYGDFLELFPYPGRGTKRETVPPFPNLGFARSAQYNGAYYDPADAYPPWKKYDGTSWENLDTQAEWAAVKVDPRAGVAGAAPSSPTLDANLRYDLTQTIYDRADDTSNPQVTVFNSRALYSGVRLKAGWLVRSDSNSTTASVRRCFATPANFDPPRSSSAFVALTQDYTLTAACANAIDVLAPANTGNNNPSFGTNGETFDLRQGMVIPAGTQYFTYAQCGGLGGNHADLGTWTTTSADVTIGTTCDIDGNNASNNDADFKVAFSYYAPTYYLSTSTSPDGNINGTPFTYNVSAPATQGGPRNATLYRFEIRPGNYGSSAAYEAAMTNFANWFTYYRNRNLGMVAALTHSMSGIGAMNVGYFTINSGLRSCDSDGDGSVDDACYDAYTNVNMRDMDDTVAGGAKDLLYGQLTQLPANGSTPNRWATDWLGQQFQRTDAGTPLKEACQVNAGMLFTDGYSNQGGPNGVLPNDSGMGAPFADTHANTMADIAAKYYLSSLRSGPTWDNQKAVPSACSSATPDPRLDCRDDPHMNFYGITLGALGEAYGTGVYVNDPATSLDEATEALFSTPYAWGARQDDNPRAVDEIWHAAVNSRGRFINASSPAKITEAMNEVLTAVIDTAQPSGGTAASGQRRDSGFLVYVPEYDPGDWSGDVAAYRLAADGSLGSLVWRAAAKLPAEPDRNIFVSVPDGGGTKVLRSFEKGNLGADDATAAAALGFGAGPGQTALPSGSTIDDAIDYLRGDNSRMQPAVGGVFRQRATKIGDILNSQPAVLDSGSRGFTSLAASAGGGRTGSGSYGEFVETVKKARTPVVFVGTNGGMIHAINGSADATSGGAELFAVIPNSVLSNMNRLVQPSYVHRFYNDASPELGDARVGGAWKTVLLSGNGGGGRSIIAMDVTDPVGSGFSTSNMLFEFTDEDLGLTYGRPQIMLLPDDKWYAVFGNGYNSGGNPLEAAATRGHDAYLYLVPLDNPSSFTKIRAATGSDSDLVNFTSQNGLGAPTGLDTDFDLKADVIYAPDYRGNVWKFDVSGASPSSWGVGLGGSPLYTATYDGTNRQNITGGVSVALHHLEGYMVYFGTGRYFLQNDGVVTTTAPTETFYAIWDKGTPVVGRSNLVQQSIVSEATVTGIGETRTTSSNVIDWSTKQGWYLNLQVGAASGRGERIIGRPQIGVGTVFVTSFVPVGSTCVPGGRNWLYALSAATGAPDVNMSNPTCPNCGAVSLTPEGGSQAPTPTPPIITDPAPPPGCAPGDTSCQDVDPECPPGVAGCDPLDPGRVFPAPSPDVIRIRVVMPNGTIVVTEITRGRQAWRQVE